MKKNNLFILAVLVLSVCFLCSCGLIGPQRYICDITLVESVQIVEIYNFDVNHHDCTVITTISDYTEFINRLNKLKHSVNWGDPSVMELNIPVVKINYSNGDFDLIHCGSQIFCTSGRYNTGYFFFDQEQFQDLISDYLTQ